MSVDSATAYVGDGIASEADVRNGGQKPRATLRREIHAAQEVLEARVGTQAVEARGEQWGAPDLPPVPKYAGLFEDEMRDCCWVYSTGPKYLSSQSRDSLINSFLGTK